MRENKGMCHFRMYSNHIFKGNDHEIFTCSKSTIETPEKCVKYIQS